MKFDFKHGALALGIAALMTACSGGGKYATNTEWFVCADDDGENYGFFNPGTGKMMYEGEFSNAPTSIVDGLFTVEEGDGISVYTTANAKSPKVLGDLEGLASAGIAVDGLMPICRPNSRIEVYSVSESKAEPVFTLDPIDGKEITVCASGYVDGLLIIANEDGMMGAVDKAGSLVIPFEYNSILQPHNGMIVVGKESDGLNEYKWFVINAKGEEILKFKKGVTPAWGVMCDNGYFVLRNDETNRYVLATAKEEYFNLPKDVEGLSEIYGDYAVFMNGDNKYGVLKIKGDDSEVVVRAKYEGLNLLPWEPTKFVCTKGDDEYVIMDLDGNKVVDFGDDYESVLPCYTPNWKGFIAYEHSSHGVAECVCYDEKGEKIKFEGVHELYNLHISNNDFGSVASDYFNLDEFVRQVTAAISTDGLCGYEMGSYADQYFSDDLNPRNCTYTYWFTPKDDSEIKGYRYSSSIRLSAYRHLAQSSWDYYTRTTSYYFTSDNPLDGMELTIYAPNNIWEKAGEKIKDAIENKGFTVDTEGDSSIRYYTPDRDATLTLSWTSWGTIGLKYYKNY